MPALLCGVARFHSPQLASAAVVPATSGRTPPGPRAPRGARALAAARGRHTARPAQRRQTTRTATAWTARGRARAACRLVACARSGSPPLRTAAACGARRRARLGRGLPPGAGERARVLVGAVGAVELDPILAVSPGPCCWQFEGSGSGGSPAPGPVTLPAVRRALLLNQQLLGVAGELVPPEVDAVGHHAARARGADVAERRGLGRELEAAGARPIWLPYNWLLQEVEMPLSGAPGQATPGEMSPSPPPPLVSASGTANSRAPSRQLSKKWLSCTRASFMPA